MICFSLSVVLLKDIHSNFNYVYNERITITKSKIFQYIILIKIIKIKISSLNIVNSDNLERN